MPIKCPIASLSFYLVTRDARRRRADSHRYPRATVNYLSIPVADVKGFFRSEGIENETIVIPGSTAIAALVSGECRLQRSGRERHASSGPRGADQSDHVPDRESDLVSHWRARYREDFRPQRKAHRRRHHRRHAGYPDYHACRGEGSAARDITRVAMPSRSTATTFLSLKTGAVSAAVVNADESLLGEKEGMRTLAFIGDLFPYPFQGFLATEKKSRKNPETSSAGFGPWRKRSCSSAIVRRKQPTSRSGKYRWGRQPADRHRRNSPLFESICPTGFRDIHRRRASERARVRRKNSAEDQGGTLAGKGDESPTDARSQRGIGRKTLMRCSAGICSRVSKVQKLKVTGERLVSRE